MKKAAIILYFFAIICAAGTTLHAQDFTTTLKQTFNSFDAADDYTQKTALGNRLVLIAAKWDKEWTAHYYVAYSKAILSSLERDDTKRDALLDEADKEHDKTVAILGRDNDETLVLAALIANWRIAISPMLRSGQYAKVFRENMSKAKALNPNNPRIYYLQGMAKYSMPKFVGGGKQVALPYLAKADTLFAAENNSDISKPYWGKTKNAFYLNECKKE
jgi:hypothetical protein